MMTLAQAIAERLRELRAICRENGERLDRQLADWARRDVETDWFRELEDAAWSGAEISPAVWRSALKHGSESMVRRLMVRHDVADSYVRTYRVHNAQTGASA